MTEQKIRFDCGAAYERMMGKRRHLPGDIFLGWLAIITLSAIHVSNAKLPADALTSSP